MLNENQKLAVESKDKHIVVVAAAGSGKAILNGTGVLTDTGYRAIETLEVNDKVYSSDGKLHNVLGVYPQGKKQIYTVMFSDKTVIHCCKEHLWIYYTKDNKEHKVNTTEELIDLMNTTKIFIPLTEPIEFNAENDINSCYLIGKTVGLQLMENTEMNIIDKIKYSTINNRIEFLSGVFNTGAFESNGKFVLRCQNYNTYRQIAFIAETLGMTVKVIYNCNFYLLTISVSENIYPKLISNLVNNNYTKFEYAERYIEKIIKTELSSDMTCIEVDSEDHSFLTEHCIVTHNTHTLISRIERIINDGANPDSLLVLTFTNNAAAEMKQRYKKNNPNKKSPMFATFHSFCYQLIVKDKEIRSALGYEDIPNIPPDAIITKLSTQVRQQCKTTLSDKKLNTNDVRTLTMQEKYAYDLYWKRYKKVLAENNYITFDVMCNAVSMLYTTSHPATEKYKKKYKYLFVDEFQDTDNIQWLFVQSFGDADIFVVGDPKQNLYSFRGTTSKVIKQLTNLDFWTTIKLDHNYRSTKQICEYANKIHSSYSGSNYDLQLVSDKEGTEVSVKSGYTPNMVINAIKDSLTSDENANKSIAIIARTNKECSEIRDSLKQHGIAYNVKDSRKDAYDLIHSATDKEYCVTWLSEKLNSADYNEYIKLSSIDPEYLTYEKFVSVYYDKIKSFATPLFNIINILKSNISVAEKAKSISKQLRIKIDEDVVINFKSCNEMLEYMLKKSEYQQSSNIYVGTIHSVKGLEYDIVHIVGVGSSSFKITSEEDKNVFYVACTRAKETLYVWKG